MRVRIDGMIADKVGADRGRERSRGCDGDGGREERVERDVVLIYRALRQSTLVRASHDMAVRA